MATLPQNDNGCGWLNILNKRVHRASLSKDINAKWLIVGAGYSGLAAALTLAENLPNDEIVLIDANAAGEGASARNSGYLVDTTLNDGHLSDTGLKSYQQKYELNKKAADNLKQMVDKYNIICDWNECGKFYASSTFDNELKLNNFIELLDKLNLENQFFNQQDLAAQLGTGFYKMAVKTFGGAMLQPAALARGLIDALPHNVSLYEHTPVVKIKHGDKHIVSCAHGEITADNLIIAVNGFMPSLKIKSDRAFPLLLTASLTRPLTDDEQKHMNEAQEWGVLSANHMGATLRYTSDKRLMIRNTVEVSSSLRLNDHDLKKRKAIHLAGLKVRFPFLADDVIAHSWSGITCISANNANVFDEIYKNCWAIGCYNGGGVGLANLFGQEIAYQALNKSSDVKKLIDARPKPNWLPPQPVLNWGVRLKLAKDKFKATEEV
ncbi:MAG: FAD-binding oxidoreductase [OCS116 cluster bacterium]|uniref:Amino acid oxidase n=1 Tax=OCS116 cluster bacterium TaxID=2030921 RepID=A0A2A4YRG9_9PROT|nr:FAD-binding oxidoreductase [OCS116 cluster bacterium]